VQQFRFSEPASEALKSHWRTDSIIAACQLGEDSFELWSLAVPVFCSEMRVTRNKGDSAGKIGQVGRSVFVSRGRSQGRVRVGRTR
jgi:hypothetical protein